MITVKEATDIILAHTIETKTETVAIQSAYGRFLKNNLIADRDFPPYDRVTMDGIAIRHEDFAAGQRQFKIKGTQAAGQAIQTLSEANACYEVMTGAVLPQGADAIIRYEDLEINEDIAIVKVDQVKFRQNIHAKGSDRQKGDIIVNANVMISAAEIGVAATIGKSSMQVGKSPKIAIISTGDELVKITETPLPHQIRQSNASTVAAALYPYQVRTEQIHVADDTQQMHSYLLYSLEQFDAVILCGGVSKGKYDYVPDVLKKLHVEQLFHKVKQRPGKPFWFGKSPNGKVVFALPGNPVSTFMCLYRYFIPWLRSSLGMISFPAITAILNEDLHFTPQLQYFPQVKLQLGATSQLLATPIRGNGSGDLASLVDADGFLELPADRSDFRKGEEFPLIRYRDKPKSL